jgi:hypothetical protein
MRFPLAFRRGLLAAFAIAAIPQAVRVVPTAAWMRALLDITLLDHIFSQQDRIGNIAYLVHRYWIEGGELRRMPARGAHSPDDIARFSPNMLKRAELGDNDAGVRTTFGLTPAELAQIAANVRSAAMILQASCRAGRLRFGLDPEALLRDGRVAGQRVDCGHP